MPIVTAKELAEIHGVTTRRLSQWVSEGMPRSQRNRYDVDECNAWIEQRRQSRPTFTEIQAEHRERFLRIKADLEEVKLEAAKGMVVPTEDVRQAWLSWHGEIKAAHEQAIAELHDPRERERLRAWTNRVMTLAYERAEIGASALKRGWELTPGKIRNARRLG